jgi:hypothetical protein
MFLEKPSGMLRQKIGKPNLKKKIWEQENQRA